MIQHQSRAEFRADIRRSKALLEDITGGTVSGYRAPSYSIVRDTWWALEEIRDAGYTFDSSIYPVRAPHGRYGVAGAPLHPFEPCPGLREFPLPVARIVGSRFPAAAGGYLRHWPMMVHRLALRQYQRDRNPMVINVHPWELDVGQPRLDVPWRQGLLHYSGLHRTRRRLRDLLTQGRFTSLHAWQQLLGRSVPRSVVLGYGDSAFPTPMKAAAAERDPALLS
jgi:polysaccharide deacetylase family protein (PEP-CTERM system associated)